ncbi:hypothetical protein GCM10009744_26650 [Kribbella alba]|uniref:Uncharacterized protein n=1 Tax=Kribbella alba TaxID=190197 RepID=A0ABN2F9C5_9ACTN
MDTDQGTWVLRRFSESLHGATILTLHCDSSRPGRSFGADVVDQLSSDGLLGHVLWSTRCTPGDVSAAVFQSLRDTGLFLVRLDLSGIPADPLRLRELLVAVQTLRRAGILVEYDLDLFGRSPRFAKVRERLAMLQVIVADGSTPAVFSIPADGAVCSPWVDTYRRRLGEALEPWLGEQGLADQLAEAWTEIVVAERLLLGLRGVAAHRIALQRLTLRINTELLNLVSNSAREFETAGETTLLSPGVITPRATALTDSMVALRNRFLCNNAPVLLAGTLQR